MRNIVQCVTYDVGIVVLGLVCNMSMVVCRVPVHIYDGDGGYAKSILRRNFKIIDVF